MAACNKFAVFLFLALDIAAVASPALSKERMSAARAKAIRECNSAVGSLRQRTWGKTEFTKYRICMAARGMGE
jgi:hypothetical protein